MIHKLIKASVAGAAALALAAGGSTFAGWSDFGVEDAEAAAGFLKLDVSSQGSPALAIIQPFELAPGMNQFREFYLASADSDNTPDGDLTAVIQNLVDTEDGAPGCTTNSEALAEAPGNVDPVTGLPTNPLNDCGSVGELSDQARMSFQYSDPVSSAADCQALAATDYQNTTPPGNGTVNEQVGEIYPLGTVAPGQGVCVRVLMFMPDDEVVTIPDNDLAQGDQMSFNIRFDLNQS